MSARETLAQRVQRLEEHLRIERAAFAVMCGKVKALESGEVLAKLREQRDVLWLFARNCRLWAHDCQCDSRALDAMAAAGLMDKFGDLEHGMAAEVSSIDPRLALRLTFGGKK